MVALSQWNLKLGVRMLTKFIWFWTWSNRQASVNMAMNSQFPYNASNFVIT
jgi:hypothetical protein